MANVNMAELRSTLEHCVEFCRKHDERDYCQRHRPLLENALEELEESRKETDQYFADWRECQRQQKKSWKELAGELRDAQKELDRVNAYGYPDERIRYWDEERLEEAIDEMIEYLQEHTDEIDFAADLADKLDRKLDIAHQYVDEQEDALDVYRSKIKKRSDAMGGAAQVIGDFRELLRDELGIEDEEYQSIRWPYNISPDDATI
jgi:chromosome segregation ATPase